MRIRKLQCLDENSRWITQGYACEISPQIVIFRYSTKSWWGRVWAFYNRKIRQARTQLENLEDTIYPTRDLHWLPVEILTDHQVDMLNQACGISNQTPRPFA